MATAEEEAATFVLVHGAMHGGWCWAEVAERLRGLGHRVFAPTLTGQGERRHSLTREVGPADHVGDLVELLWFEDLRHVHLVLHSYAGVLAGPVADAVGERLGAVVYLAGFVARTGESLLDVEPPDVAERYRHLVAAEGDGWLLRARESFLAQWSVPVALRPMVGARLTDFPCRCLRDPVRFDPTRLDALPKAYVRHTDPPLPGLQRSIDRAVVEGWPMRELRCGHDTMLAAPEETAAVLDELRASVVG